MSWRIIYNIGALEEARLQLSALEDTRQWFRSSMRQLGMHGGKKKDDWKDLKQCGYFLLLCEVDMCDFSMHVHKCACLIDNNSFF